MSTIHEHQTTIVTLEQFLPARSDFGPGPPELSRPSKPEIATHT